MAPLLSLLLVNVFRAVGGVQPLHLSPTQMLGEAEADEHSVCVCLCGMLVEFKASVLLRGHFLTEKAVWSLLNYVLLLPY